MNERYPARLHLTEAITPNSATAEPICGHGSQLAVDRDVPVRYFIRDFAMGKSRPSLRPSPQPLEVRPLSLTATGRTVISVTAVF